MSTELGRTQFGMTSKGQVVVIEKQSFDDQGSNLVSVFEVKHGVRTVGKFDSAKTAAMIAKALVLEKGD